MSTTVYIREASINTTVSKCDGDIDELVRSFLSNHGNENKIIGLDTERSVINGRYVVPSTSKLFVLQLCDGDNCLIIPLPRDQGFMLPISLINFLNLPDFTFVSVGIHKALEMLQSGCGLTCKNVVEIGPSSWDLFSQMTYEKRQIISQFVSTTEQPTTTIFEDWYNYSLSENQIKVAAANAYFAFKIGNLLISVY